MRTSPADAVRRSIVACFATGFFVSTSLDAAELKVDADFPGGAAEVVEIDQVTRMIRFKLAKQPSGEWASWWYLRVRGITPGETVRLEMTETKQAPAGRAVFSTDGKTWRYTQAEGKSLKTPIYKAQVDAEEARFAWYVPYLPQDAAEVVERAAQASRFARKFTLCKSEGGIAVPAVTFADPETDSKRQYGVWISARQHAWEVGGSWSAQGLINWLASDDPRAAALCRKARVTVIPLVDVDSVAAGRGGKNQRPHDHNRDWSKDPYWRATRAALAELKPLDETGRLDLYVDLHDPGWGGNIQFWCHAYGVMESKRKRNTDWFVAAATEEIVGPLRFDGKPTVRYALTTPTAGIWSCTKTRNGVVGGTFEIGVAPPAGYHEPPPTHHLSAGRQIGLTIERFLRNDVRADETSPSSREGD
jgi:hypothetical protein